MIIPEKRIVTLGIGSVQITYEVLDEFYRYWKQAKDALDRWRVTDTRREKIIVTTTMKTWQEAIETYCGWSMADFNEYVAQRQEEESGK